MDSVDQVDWKKTPRWRLCCYRSRFFVAVLIGAMASVGWPAAESVSLIADPTFQNGAEILAPEQGAAIVLGVTQPPWHSSDTPEWTLRQWDSRFNLAEAEETLLAEDAYRVSDAAKWVVFAQPDSQQADLVMGMDSRVEWSEGPRERGESGGDAGAGPAL